MISGKNLFVVLFLSLLSMSDLFSMKERGVEPKYLSVDSSLTLGEQLYALICGALTLRGDYKKNKLKRSKKIDFKLLAEGLEDVFKKCCLRDDLNLSFYGCKDEGMMLAITILFYGITFLINSHEEDFVLTKEKINFIAELIKIYRKTYFFDDYKKQLIPRDLMKFLSPFMREYLRYGFGIIDCGGDGIKYGNVFQNYVFSSGVLSELQVEYESRNFCKLEVAEKMKKDLNLFYGTFSINVLLLGLLAAILYEIELICRSLGGSSCYVEFIEAFFGRREIPKVIRKVVGSRREYWGKAWKEPLNKWHVSIRDYSSRLGLKRLYNKRSYVDVVVKTQL